MNLSVDQIMSFSRDVLNGKITINTQELMDTLCDVLIFHEHRYYIVNEPLLSDTEYDLLYKKLEAAEDQYPQLKLSHSPTERVGRDLTDTFSQVSHLSPMLSLANSYNESDLIDFDAQIRRFLNIKSGEDLTYSVEPKFDGGSISAVYENDYLIRVATRGDGSIGEDITNNGKVIRSLPLKVPFSKIGIKTAELRGEAIISKNNFKEINAQRESKGLQLFSNPRNAATGGLRTKDPAETEERRLDVFLYSIGFTTALNDNDGLTHINSHHESIDMLQTLGFKVPVLGRKRCHNIKEVIEFCEYWERERDSFPYEIDGMVIKLDNKTWQERAGFTSHHPRWAIAFKFQAKQAATKLLDVEFQVGKIGSITPVGKLAPVALAGVTVSSVSLHNEEFIQSRDLMLGDMVLIERAGDVIPYVVKSLSDVRTGAEKPIHFPERCPSCGTTLIKQANEAAWRCMNSLCPEQTIQKLIFFVSKEAMDIEGFGKSNVERFYELGWLRKIDDIYQLSFEQIANLPNSGAKSAKKLIESIEKSKSNPIHKLLHGLSIHHLGKKAAKLIANEIDHVLDLKAWTYERFENIKDIGPVVAKNVVDYFAQNDNIEMLQHLEELGVNLKRQESASSTIQNPDNPFFGKTILFTGTLHRMGRKEAQEKAEMFGAKNLSAVSSNLDILVVGENAGSKLKKAKDIGTVRILTEDEFLEIIQA